MRAASRITKATKKTQDVPPLQNGDHLTVEEFEHRYESMPEVKKAELIEGIVYMPSPVTQDFHGNPAAIVITWLGVYAAYTPGTEHGDNSTLKLQRGASEPQPDALLLQLAEYGGQSHKDEDGYIVGAPEVLAEIAASSVAYDLHEKLFSYEKNGVLEYIVWRVEDEAVDWFFLRGGKFIRLKRGSDGIYRSKVFPGLWLDPAALVAGNLARVLEVVQQGIASPEHARFVDKLKAKKK
jgi:hypothetical protein